jgi:hypothetical protein
MVPLDCATLSPLPGVFGGEERRFDLLQQVGRLKIDFDPDAAVFDSSTGQGQHGVHQGFDRDPAEPVVAVAGKNQQFLDDLGVPVALFDVQLLDLVGTPAGPRPADSIWHR